MTKIKIAIPDFFVQSKNFSDLEQAIKEGLVIRDYMAGRIKLKEVKDILDMHDMDSAADWLQIIGIQNTIHKPTETGESSKRKSSKWAEISKRIKNDPDIKNPEFQKAWSQMKEEMKELRESLEFIHDK